MSYSTYLSHQSQIIVQDWFFLASNSNETIEDFKYQHATLPEYVINPRLLSAAVAYAVITNKL